MKAAGCRFAAVVRAECIERTDVLFVFVVAEEKHLAANDRAAGPYASVAERELFRLLSSVSLVGASIARTLLSSLAPEQVLDAISQNDIPTIQAVKGIGAKTAQRVVLDLKDKILKVYGLSSISAGASTTHKNEALSALETLGFNKKLAEKAVEKIVKETPEATVETIIKQALKNL